MYPEFGLFMIPHWTEPMRSAGHLVLLQFTGLHDKNGKEIWEGDLFVTCQHGKCRFTPEQHAGNITEVKWVNGPVKVGWNMGGGKTKVVIGNIYSDPHLLKGNDRPDSRKFIL